MHVCGYTLKQFYINNFLTQNLTKYGRKSDYNRNSKSIVISPVCVFRCCWFQAVRSCQMKTPPVPTSEPPTVSPPPTRWIRSVEMSIKGTNVLPFVSGMHTKSDNFKFNSFNAKAMFVESTRKQRFLMDSSH